MHRFELGTENPFPLGKELGFVDQHEVVARHPAYLRIRPTKDSVIGSSVRWEALAANQFGRTTNVRVTA